MTEKYRLKYNEASGLYDIMKGKERIANAVAELNTLSNRGDILQKLVEEYATHVERLKIEIKNKESLLKTVITANDKYIDDACTLTRANKNLRKKYFMHYGHMTYNKDNKWVHGDIVDELNTLQSQVDELQSQVDELQSQIDELAKALKQTDRLLRTYEKENFLFDRNQAIFAKHIEDFEV